MKLIMMKMKIEDEQELPNGKVQQTVSFVPQYVLPPRGSAFRNGLLEAIAENEEKQRRKE